jgi:hypothetical protein
VPRSRRSVLVRLFSHPGPGKRERRPARNCDPRIHARRTIDATARAAQAARVPRVFNTAGPNDPQRHFTVPASSRLPGVRRLVDQGLCFALHAPRGTGKTTSLLALCRELTAEDTYVAVVISMEAGAAFPKDLGAAELAILDAWRDRARAWLPAELQPPIWADAPPGNRIGSALRAWAQAAPRPLVVFLDGIDALQGDVLISVLRQIRDGFPDRPRHFPHALALVGLLSTASFFFNIKAESITLRNFTREEVGALYGQHTAETGQPFLPEAVDRAFHLTQGQPWLVNALARQLTEELVPERAEPIAIAHVDQASEILIRRQDTHLDSLIERVREPRVRAIVEPMLAGDTLGDVPEDDRRFAVDLGLVRRSESGGLDEVAPHLVLMAFLHRVVNGGTIEREYAIGRGRMDLCLRHAGETLATTTGEARLGALLGCREP